MRGRLPGGAAGILHRVPLARTDLAAAVERRRRADIPSHLRSGDERAPASCHHRIGADADVGRNAPFRVDDHGGRRAIGAESRARGERARPAAPATESPARDSPWAIRRKSRPAAERPSAGCRSHALTSSSIDSQNPHDGFQNSSIVRRAAECRRDPSFRRRDREARATARDRPSSAAAARRVPAPARESRRGRRPAGSRFDRRCTSTALGVFSASVHLRDFAVALKQNAADLVRPCPSRGSPRRSPRLMGTTTRRSACSRCHVPTSGRMVSHALQPGSLKNSRSGLPLRAKRVERHGRVVEIGVG